MDSNNTTKKNLPTYVLGSHQPIITCLCGECLINMDQMDIEEVLAILEEEKEQE